MLYSISRRTVLAAGAVAFDVAAGAGAKGKLIELGVFNTTNNIASHLLNFPTAIGTRTTPVVLLPEEDPDAPASEHDSAIAWSVNPTLAANNLRAIALPVQHGGGVLWAFPKGLMILPSKSIALVDSSLSSHLALDVYAVVDE